MIESGKSLSYSKKYCSALEKILRLYDIKQNEKHPFIKLVMFCKKRTFVITEDGDIDRFSAEEMDVIYQASDEDFNCFEAQVRELMQKEIKVY